MSPMPNSKISMFFVAEYSCFSYSIRHWIRRFWHFFRNILDKEHFLLLKFKLHTLELVELLLKIRLSTHCSNCCQDWRKELEPRRSCSMGARLFYDLLCIKLAIKSCMECHLVLGHIHYIPCSLPNCCFRMAMLMRCKSYLFLRNFVNLYLFRKTPVGILLFPREGRLIGISFQISF